MSDIRIGRWKSKDFIQGIADAVIAMNLAKRRNDLDGTQACVLFIASETEILDSIRHNGDNATLMVFLAILW